MYLLRNPLEFPAGFAPGFDPSHPVATNTRFSGVAMGGSFINLLSGKKGVITGAPTAAILPTGPATTMSATTHRLAFSGMSTINDTEITLAAIFTPNAGTTNRFVCATDSADSGGWAINTTGVFQPIISIYPSFGFKTSGLEMTVGEPYFVAASCDANKAAFVLTNMRTGQTRSSTVGTGLASSAPNGTHLVGGTLTMSASINATMAAGRFSSVELLRKWAEDPWAFWYPDAAGDAWTFPMVGAAAGGSPQLIGGQMLRGLVGRRLAA